MTRATFAWLGVLALVSVGCGKGGSEPPAASSGDAGASGVAGAASTGVEFTADQLELLRSLSPAQLPAPPPDVSNAFAESAEAAALGQRWFFDAGFAGKLLDADNDGGPNALGARGQSGKVACSGCHMPSARFADTRSTFQEISLGTGWTHRRTPSLEDVGQATIVTWGGRHSTLWSQPFGPLENPLEMNTSRLFVAQEIARRYADEYAAVFGGRDVLESLLDGSVPQLTADTTGCKLTKVINRPRALPPDPSYECHGAPGDQAEYDGLSERLKIEVSRIVVNFGKALAAYERKLTCGPGRFDAFVAGDANALSEAEQRGLELFIGKGKCVDCHSGPFFSDQKFHNVGMKEVVTKEGIFNGNDRGAAVDLVAAKADPVGLLGQFSDGTDDRMPEVIDEAFEGAFRTPTLRCVARRPSFMHSGTMHALETVVAFFASGGDTAGYPGKSEIEAVSLTPRDISDTVAFLKALDGAGSANDLLRAP